MSEHENDQSNAPESPEPVATSSGTTETMVIPAAKTGGRAGRILVVGIVIAALATAGSIMAFRSSTGSDPAASRVSASVDLFAQINLAPSIEQQRAIRDFADRVPGGRDAAEAMVDKAVSRIFEEAPGGLSYASVRPWLGDQIAVVVPEFEDGEDGAVILVQSSDDQAAAETLQATTNDDLASRITGGWVYLAKTTDAIQSVIDKAVVDPLTRDRLFLNQRVKVGGDGVVIARVNAGGVPSSLLGLLGGGGLLGGLGSPDETPIGPNVLGVRVTDEGIVLTGISPTTTETGAGTAAVMDGLPAGLSGALSIFDVATLLREALPAAQGLTGSDPSELAQQFGFDLERDLFSWLEGETTIAVGNSAAEEFAILIEASDPDAMKTTIDRLRGLAKLAGEGDASLRVTGAPTDFVLTIEGNDVRVVLRDGRLIASSSRAFVDRLLAEGNPTLAEDVLYRKLLPEGGAVATQGFVSFRALAAVIPAEASAYVRLFDGVAFRSRFENGDTIVSLTLAYAE